MKARILAGAWLAAIAIFAGSGAAHAADAKQRQPNIVILLADDLGYADVGFHGLSDLSTPNIDSLAAGGVRFTNGYVSCPYCSPTRAGLLTGRYQERFGHEFNPGGAGQKKPAPGLPLTETTIANRLKAANYKTGLVGKWHLGPDPEQNPTKRGFDSFFGFTGGQHTFFAAQTKDIYRGTEPVEEKEYLTDAFAREAVSFIDQNKADPFFLYLAFNAVHTPLDVTDDRFQRFAHIEDPQRRKYAAMLTALDEGIGRVLEKLRAEGLEEDTLIFFLSDNGGPVMPTTSINGANNAPLRGSKRTTLEGGVRVPFVAQWKGKLPAGKVYPHPVIQLDILPTALAAAHAPVGDDANLDGVNLIPYLTGENDQKPHETLFWRLGPQRAIRQGEWKLVQYDVNADSATDTNRAGSSRGRPEVTAPKLYNLIADPGETNDLAAQHPNRVAELDQAWQAWSAQLAEPLWGPAAVPQPASTASTTEVTK
jgi:arylsulfatase A-like enzyme